MKNDELLRRKKMSPHNSVKSRPKFTPPRDSQYSVHSVQCSEKKENNNEPNFQKETRKRSCFSKLSAYWTLSTVLLLSGCMGIYEGGFECPPGKGVGCKSISDVNQMVDQGDLPERSHPDLPQPYCKKCGTHQDQEIDPKHHEKPKVWYAPLNLEEV